MPFIIWRGADLACQIECLARGDIPPLTPHASFRNALKKRFPFFRAPSAKQNCAANTLPNPLAKDSESLRKELFFSSSSPFEKQKTKLYYVKFENKIIPNSQNKIELKTFLSK